MSEICMLIMPEMLASIEFQQDLKYLLMLVMHLKNP
jgi:hypothetical protein